MRALVQRVARAAVRVDGRVTGAIGPGLLVLLGATHADAPHDAAWLARKIAGLRVFGDPAGLMNLDLHEVGGAALVVPQFTLYGDARRGRRPDFTRAARPEHAEPLFESFCAALAGAGVRVERGVFRAHMEVELVNDGPVTLWVESPGTAVRGGEPGPPAPEPGA
ncbi:MAG TPA: D-aminoacyl-tRNA deacylase [Candidatus Eisenbacteria bacterium]